MELAQNNAWKTRITSTMRTNSRMNALLSDSMSIMNLVKKKNLIRLRASSTVFAPEEFGDGVNLAGARPVDANNCRKANMDLINRLIRIVIDEQMATEKFFSIYNSQISTKFSQILSREIKDRIKDQRYERYRIVCLVTIVEKLQQAINYEMMFCLDPKTDNFTTYRHETATYVIVVAVIMVFKD